MATSSKPLVQTGQAFLKIESFTTACQFIQQVYGYYNFAFVLITCMNPILNKLQKSFSKTCNFDIVISFLKNFISDHLCSDNYIET